MGCIETIAGRGIWFAVQGVNRVVPMRGIGRIRASKGGLSVLVVLVLFGAGLPVRASGHDSISRGQMASQLAAVLHLPSATTDFFSDDDFSAYEDAINRLAQAGSAGRAWYDRMRADEGDTLERMYERVAARRTRRTQ